MKVKYLVIDHSLEITAHRVVKETKSSIHFEAGDATNVDLFVAGYIHVDSKKSSYAIWFDDLDVAVKRVRDTMKARLNSARVDVAKWEEALAKHDKKYGDFSWM